MFVLRIDKRLWTGWYHGTSVVHTTDISFLFIFE